MANPEHLDILRQGVKVWNAWREEHPEVQPDLWGADLSNIDLIGGANLVSANLIRVDLSNAKLCKAYLMNANLINANLMNADLYSAELRYSNLDNANFMNADLSFADLSHINFSHANLIGANLGRANLMNANLSNADLDRADLSEAAAGWTIFGNLDLSTVKGLEAVKHVGPSSIGIDTIYLSGRSIPESFLRGAGIDDTFIITYMHSLTNKPTPHYTCFISYSSKDQKFAERLYADLQNNNVRCWYAPEDLKIGDHYHQRIDESIRLYDKLVLILSEHALQSAWVEREVVAAREKEDREKRQVLFPLRLDETVMETTKAWAADVRRRWHIGDFTQWKRRDVYQQKFKRLLRDLQSNK